MKTFYSPAGNAEVWGSRPDGYYTVEQWQAMQPTPPPTFKTLAASQEQKRAEVYSAYSAVLAYLIVERPTPTPVEAALAVADMGAEDPSGLAYVRALVDARRAELLAQVDAAQSLADVAAVVVSYPV